MPAPTGPLIGLALGGLFAWAARSGASRGKETVALAPLGLVCLFTLLVFAPAAAYFVAFEPDWAYAYLIDTSGRFGALHAAVLLLDVASVPSAFVIALRTHEHAVAARLVRLGGLCLLGVATFVMVLLPRLSVQATFSQFHGDFGTRAVAGGPLGYALIWTTLVVTSAAAWTAYALRRIGSSQ